LPEWITPADLGGQIEYVWTSGAAEGSDYQTPVDLSALLQQNIDFAWKQYLPALGFSGPVEEQYTVGLDSEGGTIPGYRTSRAALDFIASMKARGVEVVAYSPNWLARHRTFAVRLPDGSIVGQFTIDTGNDVAFFFRQFLIPVFSIAGGFAFLGQQAAAITGLQPQTAASIIRTAVNVASGGDIERSLIGTIAPAVLTEYGPTTILSPPELGAIEPELLEVESVAVELAQELPPELPWSAVSLDTVAELLPELLPVFEPLPDLPPEPLPPTIEPPGVPTMDDFFTADDYDFRDFGSLDFGIDDGYFFDTVEPIPTVDAGDWFIGPMPLPDFPAIDADDTWTMPVTGGEVEDLVTVGDINVITADEVANYTGTGGAGGIVETGGTGPGTTVIEVIKDATAAMVAALGLVQAYRSLTSKPAPNPVAQARQGSNTVRANPNGTITTTTATGQTRTARPPVGQPQMTTDGTMIVNNGDGTYTRIGRDGQSVINRYPLDITQRFGAAASSPYTLPLLLAGGAALVLFATRKR
jgi:hypothetical protein